MMKTKLKRGQGEVLRFGCMLVNIVNRVKFALTRLTISLSPLNIRIPEKARHVNLYI